MGERTFPGDWENPIERKIDVGEGRLACSDTLE